jgi:hypothetical protein
MGQSTPVISQNSVTVRRSDDGWEVVIHEDGKEDSRAFVTEHFATSFAAGQMARLNLDSVIREPSEQRALQAVQ